jgi:hypothetical protein
MIIQKQKDMQAPMNSLIPLVAESLGGLGTAAIKLFAEITRSQASSRHLAVGHIDLESPDRHQPDRSRYRKLR